MPEPSAALVRLVQSKVAEVPQEGDDDYEAIHLAAYLFACASRVHALHRDSSWVKDRGPGCGSLVEALMALNSLSPNAPPHEVYWTFISALKGIEKYLELTLEGDLIALPLITQLEGGEEIDLWGIVHHWPHPVSIMATLCDKAKAGHKEDTPHPPLNPPPPAKHLRTLGMYWVDPLLPQLDPIYDGKNLNLTQLSEVWIARESSFRIALCPLTREIAPCFEINPLGEEFLTCRPEGLRDWMALDQHLRDIFADAVRERINILVFPELCIDERARGLIRDLMLEHANPSLLAVIAGSFHVWKDEEKVKPPVNEAIVMDADGQVFWRHEKRGYFRVPRGLVKRNPAFFPLPPKILADEIREGIQHGNTLRVLETPLGRLAILVCADAIEPTPYGYDALVERIHPDLLFIVSLSLETEKFQNFLNTMKEQDISTLFVNAACVSGGGGKNPPSLALVDLAFWQNPGDPATKLRWIAGGSPEWYDFHEEPEKRWKPLIQQGLTAFSSLPNNRGVIVDLAAHYRQWAPTLRGVREQKDP